MKNDFNSEDQETISMQTGIFNNLNSLLPVIKNKKRNNKILKTFYLANNKKEKSLSRNNINSQKSIFKSPNRIMHKTYTYLNKNNKQIKFISPNLTRNKKYQIMKEKFIDSQNSYNKPVSDNENLSKNSSSIKFYSITNFSCKNINTMNNKNENNPIYLRKSHHSRTLGNRNNKNNYYIRANKKKTTLQLTKNKDKKFKTNKSMKNIKVPEEKIIQFQSDSSFLNSSDEIFDESNDTNSLSNIQLDNLENKYSESNEENDKEEEYDKISHSSNKIKNGQNIYFIAPSKSTTHLKNSFKKSNLMSRTLSFYKSPIKKTTNAVKFHSINTDYNNQNKKYNIEIKGKTKNLDSQSYKNKLKHKDKQIIILSEVFDDYHTIIRRFRRQSSIIQRTLNIDINDYLKNAREKIKNKSELPFDKVLKFKEQKEDYIGNIAKNIEEKIDKSIKETNENQNEKDTFNKIIRNAFIYFYQQIIYKNWAKEIESSFLNIILSNQKNIIIPNLHYISNTFFDCFNFVIYYLLDGQYKEKQYNPRRSSIIDNNLLILGKAKKTLKHIYKRKHSYKKLDFINNHFLHSFPIKDFIKETIKNENNIQFNEPYYHFLQSRKKTRKRKRVSVHDILRRSTEKKKDIEEINKNLEKNELKYKNLINKFHETNKLLDKWSFLRKKSIFKKYNEEK